jgi:hypothetical protein
MKTIYLTNGRLDDEAGTGITITTYKLEDDGTVVGQNHTADGKPSFGYIPQEITDEEYLVWKERIANPDMETYFPGIFPGIGVVDKATRKMIDAKQVEGYKAYCEQQCDAQRINFKLAQRDAEAIGEDHEATFTSKHPEVSEAVKTLLFSEVRLTQAKAAKKKAK